MPKSGLSAMRDLDVRGWLTGVTTFNFHPHPYFAGLAFQKGGADLTLALVTAIALVNVLLVAALRLATWRR
jgi:hypothetical protein